MQRLYEAAARAIADSTIVPGCDANTIRGIDATNAILAEIKAMGWQVVPKRPNAAMLAHAVVLDSDPGEEDERLAAMAIDSHPAASSRGLRYDVIQATAQIAMDYRSMLTAAPKLEP